MENSYINSIKDSINEGNIVTFKWLSETLSISSNDAKKLLFEYAEDHKTQLKVLYCVIGIRKDSSQRSVILTSIDKLENIKLQMDVVTSIHIYSLQKSFPKDVNILCAKEYQLKTAGYKNMCENPTILVEKAKLSSISCNSSIKDRKPSPIIPPPSVISKQTKIESNTFVKKEKQTPKSSRTKRTKNNTTTPLSPGLRKQNSLLQQLSQTPVSESVLGKRKTNSRPKSTKSPEKKKTKLKPTELENKGKLTKLSFGTESVDKKRRLIRKSSQQGEDNKKEDSILWDSDEEMKSPSPVLMFSSDSDESEEESPKETIPSPKKSSPFDKYKTNNTSPGNKTRIKTTKCEKTNNGYLVFSDEIVEKDIPVTESPPRKARIIKPKEKTKKNEKEEKETKKTTKTLFSFFGGPKK